MDNDSALPSILLKQADAVGQVSRSILQGFILNTAEGLTQRPQREELRPKGPLTRRVKDLSLDLLHKLLPS